MRLITSHLVWYEQLLMKYVGMHMGKSINGFGSANFYNIFTNIEILFS